jgi:hypothetical protein
MECRLTKNVTAILVLFFKAQVTGLLEIKVSKRLIMLYCHLETCGLRLQVVLDPRSTLRELSFICKASEVSGKWQSIGFPS